MRAYFSTSADRKRGVSKALQLGVYGVRITRRHHQRVHTRIFHDHPCTGAQRPDQIPDVVVHTDPDAPRWGDSPDPAFSGCSRGPAFYAAKAIFCWTLLWNGAEVAL